MQDTTIRAVLFDKDGTLCDFDATWGAWAKARISAMARERAHAQALAAAIGFDLRCGAFDPASPVIAGTVAEVADLLLPYLPGRDRTALIAELEREARQVPLAEPVPLRELMAELRATGLRLGICTNDAETTARNQAERAGISAQFDQIIGYDSGHGAKPDPEPLLAFADLVGVVPAAVVMVGDSLHDLHAARAAGMRAVGVLTGPARADELTPMAEVILPDIGALPDWLASQDTHKAMTES